MVKEEIMSYRIIIVFLGVFAITPMAVVASEARTVTVEVVRNHAGGDESFKDLFVYTAPQGLRITGYEVIEISKFGDASYTSKKVNDSRIEIAWETRSRTKKLAGIVVDTDTASLNLDIRVTLEVIPPSQSQKSTNKVVSLVERTDSGEPGSVFKEVMVGLFVTVVGGLLVVFIVSRLKRSKNEEEAK
ncbi:MAG: hypothetical protein AB2800_12905 [Candidatus Thiodiazotropha endolucinida]